MFRRSENIKIEWKENLSSEEWDDLLTSMKGHPLQSAQWGDASKKVEGILDYRWAAFKEGKPVFLARFEDRRVFNFIKVAWIPQALTVFNEADQGKLQKDFLRRLRKSGYFLCALKSWKKIETEKAARHFTIWLDLTCGKEKLWGNLDKQFRYDVRRAGKEAVVVEKVANYDDVNAFYNLCNSVSARKGFNLKTSADLMFNLLNNGSNSGVDSHLFVVRQDQKICAGAFIMRCGENIHYLWGGVDRAFSKQRVGEAVQWKVIEWALEQNYKQYDLEGIDLKHNPGTYHFKKKLGGAIVALPKTQIYLVKNSLKIFSPLIYLQKKYQYLIQKYFFSKYVPR